MNIRTLTEIEELEKYRVLTEKYIDVLFPMEYLKQSKVVVCCLPTGEFCGGYMIVPQGDSPLRVLDSIPEEDFTKIETELGNVAEITGLWLDSKKAKTTFCSLVFWLKLYVDLASSRYDGFVYAYTHKKRNLAKIYSTFGPTTLFEGLTLQQDGMACPEVEVVQYIDKGKVRTAPYRQFSFVSRRFKFAIRGIFQNKFPILRPIRLSFMALFKIFS